MSHPLDALLALLGQKRCTKCSQPKDLTEFFPRYDRQSNNQPSSWCKRCHQNNANDYRRTNERFREHVRRYARARRYRRKFGITLDEYVTRLEAQGGGCAICRATSGSPYNHSHGEERRLLSVDHDHKTGNVRGLLCDLCNRAIGLLKDDPATLRRAADYIEKGDVLPDGTDPPGL